MITLESPEFYARYRLMNVVTNQIYNDKFALHVLSLGQIKRATTDDCKWELDRWAALFKAKTWEELKMIASNDKTLSSAAKSLYYRNADDLVRERCQAREDAIRHEERMQRQLEDARIAKESMQHQLEDARIAKESMQHELEDAQSSLAAKDAEIQRLLKEIEQLKS